MYLPFGFVIFHQRNIGTKTALKMLVKETTGSILSTFEHGFFPSNFKGQKFGN